MPHLSGITIYPVKSLDGLALSEATVLPGGALMHDRRWRLIDDEGAVVNAKKNKRFHAIRAAFQVEGIEGGGCMSQDGGNLVTLSVDEGMPGDLSCLGQETFPLVPGQDGPCGWLSEALAIDVFLQERFEAGFPDDCDAPGPTLISYESLNEVARWFDWDIEEARRRFRMNFEIATERDDEKRDTIDPNTDAIGPFWEDSLACPVLSETCAEGNTEFFFEPECSVGDPSQFKIGAILFQAVGVCRRCVVPGRNSLTGELSHLFRDRFEAFRLRRLPHNVEASNWSNFYRLGINTTLKSDPGSVETGHPFTIVTKDL
ncbi:MOSC N-terminal beta barrel domain-containing protein [Pirellulales bacterium]|nr:MOSC N-terminal beta barrel domain-containing protein [Pirellulales bacterium]